MKNFHWQPGINCCLGVPWGLSGVIALFLPDLNRGLGWHTESFDPHRSEDDELVGVQVAFQHRESLAQTLSLDRGHGPISMHNTST